MSSSEVAQGAPEVGAPEGAQSPVADVKEDVTATSDETQETDESRPEKAEKSKADKRLAELAYKAREAERRAKAEAEARAEIERQLEEARAGKGGAPKPEDFESYDEYLREMTRWEVRQETAAIERKRAEEAKKAEQMEAQSRKAARIETVTSTGRDAYHDFDTTLAAFEQAGPNPDEIRAALDEILDSDRAADLLYYLAKNPTEAHKLSTMSPSKQAREIGRLEALFESKKLTAAPPPAKTLKGSGGRVTSDAPPADPVEYRKWRAKQK